MKPINIRLPGIAYRQVGPIIKSRILFASLDRVGPVWRAKIGRFVLCGAGLNVWVSLS